MTEALAEAIELSKPISQKCGTETTLCDWAMAKEFLAALDPNADAFTFQLFSDDKSLIRYERVNCSGRAPGEADQRGDRHKKVRKDPNAQIINSALTDRLCEKFERLNRGSAYIGVTVNETDGKGRTLQNIVRVRAVIADFDNGLPESFPLEPSALICSSSGKYQAYWFVGDTMQPATASGVAVRLARDYGADANCIDLARVFRLPGSCHMKTGKPRLVTVKFNRAADGLVKKYLAETITKAFPPVEIVTREASLGSKAKHGAADVAHVVSALDYIAHLSSGLEPRESFVEHRASWFKVLCALKREYGDGGLEIAHEWSKLAGSEVYDEYDLNAVWSSIHEGNYSGKPCTVGSIFHWAKAAGWTRPDSMDEVHTLASDMAQHAPFVEKQPINPVAIPKQTTTALEFGRSVSNWDAAAMAKMLEIMNTEHAVIPTEGGSVRILWTKQNIRGRSENKFMRVEEVSNLYNHLRFPVDGKKKNAFQAWFEWKDRRQYEGCGMFPGSEKNPAKEPRGYLNLWPGLAIVPVKGDWSSLQAHFKDKICGGNEEHFEWLMDWFAQMVQEPQKKGRSSVVLRSSKKGTGKTMIGGFLRGVLGELVAVANKVEQITGRFNGVLNGNLLLIAEEAVWGGNKTAEGAIKSLVTDETVRIEPKGLEAYDAPNFSRLLILSNNDWVAPVDIDERRWFIADLDHDQANDPKYFDPIFKQMEEDGGLAAMLYDWMAREIRLDLGRPPETTALKKQRAHGLDGLHRWLRDTAEGAGVLNKDERTMLDTTGTTTISRDVVKASARDFVKGYEERSLDTRLGILLKEVGVTDGGKKMQLAGSSGKQVDTMDWTSKAAPTRARTWVFPAAPEFAAKVAQRLKITLDCD